MNPPAIRNFVAQLGIVLFAAMLLASLAPGQQKDAPLYQSQEVSEVDGLPVLIKHLPDWESRRDHTSFATSLADLKGVLGERPILDLIDFAAGTEAVIAPYDAGKLLIVEYTTPQASVDADMKLTQFLTETGDTSTAYRRIGNYNVLVFDTTDTAAAAALIDEVKYEKQVQWLGKNPFLITAERAFVLTTADVFLSTATVIVFGMGSAVVVGIFAGFIFFIFRDGKRSKLRTFSDAGGMTRLNLDGFTPDIVPDDH